MMLRSFVSSKCALLKYIRFKPFDVSTEAGRGLERQRRIALASITGFLSQATNYIVMVAMVPLLLRYLGNEQYGLWLSISTFATFAVFADLGLGHGLVNVLGKTHGLDDRALGRKYVTSALVVLGSMAVVLFCAGVPLILKIDWAAFFQLTSVPAKKAVTPAILIFFIFFLLNLISGVGVNIRMAHQEMHINNAFLAAGKILSLIGVIIGIAFRMPFLFFVVMLAGIQTLSLVVNSCGLLLKSRRWLIPARQAIDWGVAKELFSTGSFFFVTGIAGILATQIDTLVIARFLGAETVPSFAIPLKLFLIATTVLSFVVMPLWPAYRESIVRREMAWVKKMLFKSLQMSFVLITASSCILYFLSPYILDIWTHGAVSASKSMRATLAIYSTVASLIGPMAMFLNGANVLRGRAIFCVVSGVCNFGLSVYLVQKIGIMGPLWGTIICQATFGWGVSIYYISRVFRHEETARAV